MSNLKPQVNLIHLNQVSIFDQLLLEEYLLRDTTDNYCIINHGSTPAIVMGISGKPEELIHLDEAEKKQIPIIKRFSGGGTVAIDENTIFVTFIFNSKDVQVPCFPEPIYRFTETIYKDVFKDLPFALHQNDYILDDRKFGGNAQYIKKDRWLHHTSFLWDYNPSFMNLLKHPKKTPEYRAGRTHEEFVCSLVSFFSDKEIFLSQLHAALKQLFGTLKINNVSSGLQSSRVSTEKLDLFKYKQIF